MCMYDRFMVDWRYAGLVLDCCVLLPLTQVLSVIAGAVVIKEAQTSCLA